MPITVDFPSLDPIGIDYAEIGQLIPASSGTPVADPAAAPTLADVSGSTTLAAGDYQVSYAWVNSAGQTLPSPAATVTIVAGDQIQVTIPALPAGADSANIYMSNAVGSAVRVFRMNTVTSLVNLNSLPAAGAAAEPTTNTTGAAAPAYIKYSRLLRVNTFSFGINLSDRTFEGNHRPRHFSLLSDATSSIEFENFSMDLLPIVYGGGLVTTGLEENEIRAYHAGSKATRTKPHVALRLTEMAMDAQSGAEKALRVVLWDCVANDQEPADIPSSDVFGMTVNFNVNWSSTDLAGNPIPGLDTTDETLYSWYEVQPA